MVKKGRTEVKLPGATIEEIAARPETQVPCGTRARTAIQEWRVRCVACGKEFVVLYGGTDYAWKLDVNWKVAGRMGIPEAAYCCSYHCYRELQRRVDAAKLVHTGPIKPVRESEFDEP